jgi:hypothetical protein
MVFGEQEKATLLAAPMTSDWPPRGVFVLSGQQRSLSGSACMN